MAFAPANTANADDRQSPDPSLIARVNKLRQLSAQDSVPHIADVVQLCAVGAQVTIPRWVPVGLGSLLRPSKPIHLRFEAPDCCSVSEAAVVFGATAATFPSQAWSRRTVLELGCGAGFAGMVLAALGAHVILTDTSRLDPVATGSIALNAQSVRDRSKGSAKFCELNWMCPRESRSACATIAPASIAIATDPAVDEQSSRSFLRIVRALFGLDSDAPLCPTLECIVIAHKHRPGFCIGGYTAPLTGAPPSVADAKEGHMCLFRRVLVDEGFVVENWQVRPPPGDFAHPFVECWKVTPASQ